MNNTQLPLPIDGSSPDLSVSGLGRIGDPRAETIGACMPDNNQNLKFYSENINMREFGGTCYGQHAGVW
jgi:hypothetical protein